MNKNNKQLLENIESPICLVFNTACFGDVLVCNSLCQNIKRINSNAKVIFVVDKPFVEVAKYQKDVDDVVVFDKKGEHRGIKGILKFISSFPYKKPFVSFITYPNLRNCFVAKLLGSKYVVEGKSFTKSKLSTQEQHTRLLSKITKKEIINLPIEYLVENKVPEAMQGTVNLGGKYIGFCALTKNTIKNIPIKTSIELIKKINTDNEYKVLFFGVGKENEEYASALKAAGCEFIDLVNKTTIYELAQVLKCCTVLVSADTGTMHLGYAVKTPVVAVFNERMTLKNWQPNPSLYKSVTISSNPTAENIYAGCKFIFNKEKRLTVVIPTLQKNKELLINLLKTLDSDGSVNEIILIDNSLKGLDYSNSKLKIIIPKENMFVNPSWNYGVREAQNDIVALLNDDITIPANFCSRVVEKMSPNMGCVGFSIDNIQEMQNINRSPDMSDLSLEETEFRGNHWGIAIFFYKSSYVEIPNEMKIFCGDDWIFLQSKIYNRKNYNITGQDIYHWGSLSSASKSLSKIGDADRKIYRRYTRKWWQYIFNVEPVFRGVRITIFGIELLHHYSKKH